MDRTYVGSIGRVVGVALAALLAVFVAPASAQASIGTSVTAAFSDAAPSTAVAASWIVYCGAAGQPACPGSLPAGLYWGDGSPRNSLTFSPALNAGGAPISSELGDQFRLGLINYVNGPTYSGRGIDSVVLTATVTVDDPDAGVTFTVPVTVPITVEVTENDARTCPYGPVTACPDALVLPEIAVDVEHDGVDYRLEVLGFSDGTATTPAGRTLVVGENATRIASLAGRLTRSAGVTADAGSDHTVDESSAVTLDGSASQGAGLAFTWQQISGPDVVLDDPAAAQPRFTAPAVTDDTVLEFELTATSGLDPDAVATDTVAVTVRDTNRPPVLSMPDDLVATATGPDGAVVTYAVTATDPDGDPVTIGCTPESGTVFAVGSATVACTASDGDETVSGSFDVLVNAAPELMLPADLTVDATSPSGAVVEYPATATDDSGTPTVTCTPASGATFAIGTTTVGCSAVDDHGATTPGSFHVTVRGAGDQLADLLAAVTGVGPGNSLAAKVRTALAAPSPAAACGPLQDFVNQVRAQSGKHVPAGTATELIEDATRIRAVLGCR